MADPPRQVRALVLYCPEHEWRYAIYSDAIYGDAIYGDAIVGDNGVLDGVLRGLPSGADLAQAQAALLRRVAELTGRYHLAAWRQDEPQWWSAELVATQPPTRGELAAHLQAIGVRPDAYDLFGAHLDDAIVLDQRPTGWVVFHCERGAEIALETHRREAAACGDLLARVLGDSSAFYQLVIGPAPAEVADRAFDRWLIERNLTRDDLSLTDWRYDDVPVIEGSYQRRYFVRILSSFGRIV